MTSQNERFREVFVIPPRVRQTRARTVGQFLMKYVVRPASDQASRSRILACHCSAAVIHVWMETMNGWCISFVLFDTGYKYKYMRVPHNRRESEEHAMLTSKLVPCLDDQLPL